MGNSRGRQRGELLAVVGEKLMTVDKQPVHARQRHVPGPSDATPVRVEGATFQLDEAQAAVDAYRSRTDVPIRPSGKLTGWARYHAISSEPARRHNANVCIERAGAGGAQVMGWLRRDEAEAAIAAFRRQDTSPSNHTATTASPNSDSVSPPAQRHGETEPAAATSTSATQMRRADSGVRQHSHQPRHGLALEPYEEFRERFHTAGPLTPSERIRRLRAILSIEGPMTGRRLHSAYIRAHGGTFVAGENASTLNSTIASAVRNRILIEDAPLGEPGIRPRTYRLPGQPEARLRILGPRPFEDVPPLELARVVAAMRVERGSHSEADVYRTVLERLGSHKPLAADVVRRFAEVARLIPRAERATTPGTAGLPESNVTPTVTPAPNIPSTPRRTGGPATQTSSGRTVPLSVGAMERISSEASWIAKWLKENHELAGADRFAVQAERRAMHESRNRLIGRLDDLQKILKESVIDPTYQPSRVVSPGVIVEIRSDNGPEVGRVLITCQRDLADGIEGVSPFSPLGETLSGGVVGQTLTFVHDGRESTVTVVAVRDS